MTGTGGGASASLHHAHLMTGDLDATLAFWRTHLGAEVVADVDFAGSRNVFLRVGGARVHLYDQPPNHRGPMNHLGVLVQDVDAAVARLAADGWSTRPVKADGQLKVRYAMVEGPDGVLIELFELPADGSADPLFVDRPG